jgi:hypothetical protein
MTGTMSASTTLVRTVSEPRTPMLTTHWKARFHFHMSIISLLRPAFKRHTSLSTPPSTVRMSLIRAEDVVRYARWFSELMSGSVEVQSRALRSYRAVVMPTDALLTFGMLKLTSLILAYLLSHNGDGPGEKILIGRTGWAILRIRFSSLVCRLPPSMF